METTLTDKEAMSLAIQVAKEGAGQVSPNPLVGCVILSKDNILLGSGYHERFGDPHAEINALNNLNEETLKDARVFVTLEPCAHYGKTPPCAKKLAELPIAEVIYGLLDPNPLVSGKGIELIKYAGKKVTAFSELKEELEELCEVFLLNQRKQEVFVSLKVATTLDGMVGLKSGESKWITNEYSRNHAHFLRGIHDAILVGVNTLLADNPSLDIRHSKFPNKTNVVVILDPNGKCLANLASLKIASLHKPEEIFVFTKETTTQSVESEHCQVLQAPLFSDGSFDLTFVMKTLWDKNIRSVLVEGGAHTLSEFLVQKKAHRLYQFFAPQLVGSKEGLGWTKQLEVRKLQDRIVLKQIKITEFNQDFLVTGIIPENSSPLGKVKMETTPTKINENNSSNDRELRFYRSPNGWIFGICQGIGESFDLPPMLVRFFWILSMWWYGLGLGIYLALAISLPRKDKLDKVFKRQFLGVCGILARKTGLEIGVVRFLTVLLALSTGGFAILLYVILYFAFEEK